MRRRVAAHHEEGLLSHSLPDGELQLASSYSLNSQLGQQPTDFKTQGFSKDPLAYARSQCRPFLGLAIFLIFIFNALPQAFSHPGAPKALALTVLLVLAYKLLVFKRWRDEHQCFPTFLACFLAMVVELAVENGMVWLVSVTDQYKYQYFPPLQDNVELLVHMVSDKHPWIMRVARGRWCDVNHFLAALLALAFSVLWDQVPYSGFGIMSRATLTICLSRILRVLSFMCTILPNPQPHCYSRRFPPVPQGWWAIIKAGYTEIRGFGGCNDLIFSGHAAFWVIAPLAVQTYYPKYRLIGILLWVALFQACVRDVLDKQHYSVDMLLAVVVTWAVWSWLEKVYPASDALEPRAKGAKADKRSIFVLLVIAAALGVAGVIVIGGRA